MYWGINYSLLVFKKYSMKTNSFTHVSNRYKLSFMYLEDKKISEILAIYICMAGDKQKYKFTLRVCISLCPFLHFF